MFTWEAKGFQDLLKLSRPETDYLRTEQLNLVLRLAHEKGMMGEVLVPTTEEWANMTPEQRLEWSPLRCLKYACFYPFLHLVFDTAETGEEVKQFLDYGKTLFGKMFRYTDDSLPFDNEDHNLESGMTVVLTQPYDGYENMGKKAAEKARRLCKELGWWDSDEEERFQEAFATQA